MTASSDLVELRVERIAHGGHCVARSGEVVYFVRHSLPGELVRARETKRVQAGRVRFADAVEILEPSESRVSAPCSVAGRCGGCDFQHAELKYQRALKTEVLRESLSRFGRLDSRHPLLETAVQPLVAGESGLHWRTRVDLHTTAAGKVGFHAHSSDQVVPITDCPIAVRGLVGDGVVNRPWGPGLRLRAVRPSGSPQTAWAEGADPEEIVEVVGTWRYRLPATGFWQAHEAAAAKFIETVLDLAAPAAGEHFLDLYAGVGLFSLPLADALGAGGRVDAVEGERVAARYLARNGKQTPQLHAHFAEVGAWLRGGAVKRADAVVLDPPRTGAGKASLTLISRVQPARIVYVACDPVALARDTATLAELGFELAALRAFDAFPMTHHFESIGLFTPK